MSDQPAGDPGVETAPPGTPPQPAAPDTPAPDPPAETSLDGDAAPTEPAPSAAEQPVRRGSRWPGCLTLLGLGFLLLLVVGWWFVASLRVPPLPPTGLLTTSGTSALLSLDPGTAATIPVHVSVARAGLKDHGNTWARPGIAATLTGAAPEGLTIAVETPGGGPVVADSSAPTSVGPLRWDGSCPDASACRLDFLVVVANTTDLPTTTTVTFDARLEFPLSVPVPNGAALTVAVDPAGEPGATVSAATTGESAVDVDPAGAPIVRHVVVDVPRGEPGSMSTWLVLDARLAEAEPGPDPSRLAAGSTGGPIGKLTIAGVGDQPIVRDLVGEPHRLVAGPIAACSAGCRLELAVSVESLEVRPGAHLRLDWSAQPASVTRSGGPSPGAVAVSLSTVESTPVTTETASGNIRISRRLPATGASIGLQLDAEPAASGGFDDALSGSATVDLSVDMNGSTRRVVVPVTITSPSTMRFPGSGVTVASGATTRLLATPFQACTQPRTCEERIEIRAQLAGALASILSDDEIVVVHWTVTVSVSRSGLPSGLPGVPPRLTITPTATS